MKIWCPLHRKKVEASDVIIRDVPVNHGMRRLAEGKCTKHGITIATFISANPAKLEKPRKKAKQHSTVFRMPF